LRLHPCPDRRSLLTYVSLVAALGALAIDPSPAPAFTWGNLVITHGADVVEYRPDGTLVRTIPVPFPAGTRDANDPLGGIMFDSDARLAVYNGAAQPSLSVYDAGTGLWTHANFSGWTTPSGNYLAGLATWGHEVYVTDYGTEGGPERGVVGFDGDTGFSALRFGETFDTGDLAIGPDGRIHALVAFTSVVQIYDPVTKLDAGSVTLEGWVQGIAVREDGSYYGVSGERVRRFTPEGVSVDTLETAIPGLIDVAIGPGGDLVMGSLLGEIVVADSALTNARTFLAGGGPAYVAWVPFHPSTPVLSETWGRIKSRYRR
jgi:hypothetical protein